MTSLRAYRPPAPPPFTVHSLIVVVSLTLATLACVLGWVLP